MKPPVFPRTWGLYRHEDTSGVSGTGLVATGALFPSGKAVLEWCGTTTGIQQISIYDSLADVISIHGHGGRTEVVWFDQLDDIIDAHCSCPCATREAEAAFSVPEQRVPS